MWSKVRHWLLRNLLFNNNPIIRWPSSRPDLGSLDPLTFPMNLSRWHYNTLERHFLNSHTDTLNFIGQHTRTCYQLTSAAASETAETTYSKSNTLYGINWREQRFVFIFTRLNDYSRAHMRSRSAPLRQHKRTAQQFFCQAKKHNKTRGCGTGPNAEPAAPWAPSLCNYTRLTQR